VLIVPWATGTFHRALTNAVGSPHRMWATQPSDISRGTTGLWLNVHERARRLTGY
jgi:hypothetical protein